MKRWGRDWKVELVEPGNPMWCDLFGDIVRRIDPPAGRKRVAFGYDGG